MLDAITVDFPDVEVGLDGLDVLRGDAICRAPDYWCGRGGGGVIIMIPILILLSEEFFPILMVDQCDHPPWALGGASVIFACLPEASDVTFDVAWYTAIEMWRRFPDQTSITKEPEFLLFF